MERTRQYFSPAGIMSIIVGDQEAAGKEPGIIWEKQLHISLLGTFSIRQGDTAVSLDTPSHQALLAYLVLHAGVDHARHLLAFRFWSDSTEPQARTNLRKALYTLRRTLPRADQCLDVKRQTVQWLAETPYRIDVQAFETAVAQARQAEAPAAKQALLAEAIDQYHGDFLPGHYDDWVLAARESLRRRHLNALEEMIVLLESRRQYQDATEMARRLLRADPLHEAAYRRLMRLQSLDGNIAGALRTYHACAARLQRELGVEPGQETQKAYERLLQVDTLPAPLSPSKLPLVGRDRAWQTLQSAWRLVSRAGPAFAWITGEAGIGKTRLVEELLDWAERQGVAVLRAASYAAGGSLPYAPVTTWLRAMSNGRMLARLPDRWLLEVSRLLPELLLGRPHLEAPAPILESWQQQHFFAALAHALLQLPQPFILFIDDLQWCDSDTLQWLGYFMHFDPAARFLLVGAARSEEVAVDHPLHDLIEDVRRDNTIVELSLHRLDATETAALARCVSGQEFDEAQLEDMYAYSEGVPLFIVETARAGWPAVAAVESESTARRTNQREFLPHKVRAVIVARLSRLSPAAHDLAGLAATIGRFFTYDLLAAAALQSEAEVVHALDEL